MMKGFKRNYILFIIPLFFIFGIMTVISNNLPIITFAQVTNTNNSLLTYENSTYGITIKYPHNWSIIGSAGIEDTDVDIVTFLSPNQTDNAIVDVHQDKPGNGNRDIADYLSSTISLYKNDLHDFKVIESNTNSLLAGNKAYKLIYAYTTGDGFKMKDMEIGTIIGDRVYYIIYDGKESLFDNYMPIMKTMIDSFKVTTTNNNQR
jgi:hypothetical protein